MVDIISSYHTTSYSEFFTTYKVGDFSTIKMGHVSPFKIMRVSDVQIKINTSCTVVLKDVRCVPNLQLNLIFQTTLDLQGYDSYFKNETWKLTPGAIIVARGHICGKLYKIM